MSTTGTLRGARTDEPSPKIVPVRRPGRWLMMAATAVLVLMVANSLATNERYEWPVVRDYLFDPLILQGLLLSVELTVIAMTVGILLGIVLAFMRFSASRFLQGVAWIYIWLFRSIPALVQIIFWYNLAALYPELSIGIPFGPTFLSESSNTLITALTAAIIALGLNQAAYTSEVVRGGMLSVAKGQTEAALSLGMSNGQRLFKIVLPQAMKAILPPVGNEIISMLKNTSLVSVIALADLLYSAQTIYSRTYQIIPLLIVACIWYLVATSVLSLGQYYVEKHFSRSV